jgi:ribonuclease R
MSPQPAPEEIVEYLRKEAGRPLKAKELARAFDIDRADYTEFRKLLRKLEREGLLYRVQKQRYAVPDKINLVAGRLQTIRSGAGFVIPDEAGRGDIYIPANGLASAVDGDRVIARIEGRRRGQGVEAKVIKVLERARRTVVGIYHPAKNFGFVVPDDQKLTRDVFIPPGQEGGAQEWDVVVVDIAEWGDVHRGPAGEVVRVLGRTGDPGVDILAVIHGHELPLEFPAEVEDEAERLRERGIRPEDAERREDLRAALIFTIDPADAKDHDDAVSVRALGEGDLLEVGVHIADVGHYVEEGGALDAEALRRGTSVYLVDRVIPMLPHALSTDICSLRPEEDRLALSCFVTIERSGTIHGSRLSRSIIRSRHRLSYELAQAVLDGTGSVDAETDRALHDLAAISRVLRAARQERGSLDFDLPEARVVLDAEGAPQDIQRQARLEAHRLVEDLMLLANETVAGRAVEGRLPFLYRVHEPPDESRLEQLQEFVAPFGHRIGSKSGVRPKDLQRLLDRVAGRPEGPIVSRVVLRSMRQARYSHENLGHFGLAAGHYTHFTSPIRRYPDLVVHRLAARALIDRQRLPESYRRDLLPEVARISSERERIAVDAERDSIALKKVEFMERHLGDDFSGTIATVTSFGFFVLLDEYFVEGLVHVSSLDDDYDEFVEEQYALVGERRRRRFQLGDRVSVQVARVNREERKIDFRLHAEEVERGRPAKAKTSDAL